MTVKFEPRYFAIVLHFAGDSTITRCFPSFGFGADVKVEVDDILDIFFTVVVGFFVFVEATFVGMISAQLNNKTGIFNYFIIDFYDDIARVYFWHNKKYHSKNERHLTVELFFNKFFI
jgi:hypothetical protein